MKILFLAPQPFFQDRGTPIAVRLALEVLAQRTNDTVDLLTYGEGRQLTIPNVRQHRAITACFLRGIRPGISLKKIGCDVLFLFSALRLIWQNRHDQYALIHAVEESVFIAALIKFFWHIPYIYDMDSSLALQLTESWRFLQPLSYLLQAMERFAIRHAAAVVPVCDALAVIAERNGSHDTQILRDISLLDFHSTTAPTPVDLRVEAQIKPHQLILLYIGNLESYQGIDLLLHSFAQAPAAKNLGFLTIIGGSAEHIAQYQELATTLGISACTSFIGQRPITALSNYLRQADVLLSPRVRGNNTPMKIYSYLHSGRAIVATDLPTHTQVLNSEVALLAKPEAKVFGAALDRICTDHTLRETIGTKGRRLAEKCYTYRVFNQDLNSLYDRIDKRLAKIDRSS